MWTGVTSILSVDALVAWTSKFTNWSVVWMPVALVIGLLLLPWAMGRVLELANFAHTQVTGDKVIVGEYVHTGTHDEIAKNLERSGATRLGGDEGGWHNETWAYTDENGKIMDDSEFYVSWWADVQAKRKGRK